MGTTAELLHALKLVHLRTDAAGKCALRAAAAGHAPAAPTACVEAIMPAATGVKKQADRRMCRRYAGAGALADVTRPSRRSGARTRHARAPDCALCPQARPVAFLGRAARRDASVHPRARETPTAREGGVPPRRPLHTLGSRRRAPLRTPQRRLASRVAPWSSV